MRSGTARTLKAASVSPRAGTPSIIKAPSILSADFAQLGEEASADWIHVDVMYGGFVPNITIGPVVLQAVRRSMAKPLNVHLMVVELERCIAAFADADHLLVQAERGSTMHRHRVLSSIRPLGKKGRNHKY